MDVLTRGPVEPATTDLTFSELATNSHGTLLATVQMVNANRQARELLPARAPLAAALAPHTPIFKLPVFEGPLHLLLHLIRANKVDIYDIPIAEIAEQYLAHVALMQSLDLAVAGEYLVIAATLIEIKSRLLLPSEPEAGTEADGGEDDPRSELVERLRDYARYQDAAATFLRWEALREQIYFRGAAENTTDYLLPTPQAGASARQLFHALQQVLAQAGLDETPVPSVAPRRQMTLRIKMAEILRRVEAAAEGLPFEMLFDLPAPVYEIVLGFLALLECIRIGRIRVEQETAFGSIRVFVARDDVNEPAESAADR